MSIYTNYEDYIDNSDIGNSNFHLKYECDIDYLKTKEKPKFVNKTENNTNQIILKSKPIINIPINEIRSENYGEGNANSTTYFTDFKSEDENNNDNKNEKENDQYIIISHDEKKAKSENHEIMGDNILSSHINKELSTKESNIQIYKEKPKYNIPIETINKEIKDKNDIIKINNNKNNETKNDNTENNIHSTNYENKINNCLSSALNNKHNKYNFYYDKNKLFSLSDNIYNIINNHNQYLSKILEQKKIFEKLKELSLYALSNVQNVNNYLLKLYINTINNNYNACPFISYNSNIFNNYNKYYYNYGNQNSLLYNYRANNNILNMNDLNQFNNINNEKYTITLKSKTDDPNIEKISKIQVITSYVKDNQKVKQENDAKKDKNIKNLINLEDIKLGKETRTVVRLNPIPPNYSSFDVSKLLDKYLKIESGKNQRIYKALYTPLCKIIGKNLGYCFVMMSKPKYVIDFYNTFNGKIFGKKKCKKPCNVIWADKQGDEFLKITEEDPIRKPIIFKDLKND